MDWWFYGQSIEFFTILRTLIIHQNQVFDILKNSVMNPKNHTDNHQGYVPVSKGSSLTLFKTSNFKSFYFRIRRTSNPILVFWKYFKILEPWFQFFDMFRILKNLQFQVSENFQRTSSSCERIGRLKYVLLIEFCNFLRTSS
jgi:hypothetical protein